MSAKKLSNENNIEDILQIEWGNFTRSTAVEAHLQNTGAKVIARAKDATHLIISLHAETISPKHSNDLVTVNFELRLPKHQDLFCKSQGHNLYEAIAECKQHILRQLSDRKSLRIHKRSESSILTELMEVNEI